MARNREKLTSLTRQVQTALDNKLAIGQSKHLDKMRGTAQDKIYSWETYRSYMKHNNYFVAYCKEQYTCKTLEQCRPYVDEWLKLRSENGLSAYTQKLEASALAKMYGCSTRDFIKTDVRHRVDISRSRGEKARDYHFSEERHKDLVEFCRSTGLRRAELKALTGDKLLEKEGQYYIKVDAGSKGGRYREAPIVGDVQSVINRMNSVGTGKVFDKIPNGADIHSYRSNYCTSVYKAHERDVKTLERSEVYCCRGDLKGTWYDKKAMEVASNALGHNRISVIAEHYIRG
jgi:integrase